MLRTLPTLCLVWATAACAGDPATLSRQLDPSHPEAPEAPHLAPLQTFASKEGDAAGASSTGHFACPMHPEVRSDKPGQRCPKCGMDLVTLVPEARDAGTGSGHQQGGAH